MKCSMFVVVPAFCFVVSSAAFAQQVTKETVPGITNMARLETTVACAGAITADSVPAIKKMGFASIVNLRLATEQGAEVEKEEAAAKAASRPRNFAAASL